MELAGKFNPNTVKKILAIGGAGLLAATVASCANFDVNRVAAEQSWQATATQFALRNRVEGAIATQTAQARESNSQGNNQESVNNTGLCSLVPKDGTVSQTVQEANGGVFPPLEYGGKPVWVSLVHDGQITFSPLSDVVTGNVMNQANPGDRVCVDNTHTNPTPTPQSSIPSQPAKS